MNINDYFTGGSYSEGSTLADAYWDDDHQRRLNEERESDAYVEWVKAMHRQPRARFGNCLKCGAGVESRIVDGAYWSFDAGTTDVHKCWKGRYVRA
jgi:hypothetical protein